MGRALDLSVLFSGQLFFSVLALASLYALIGMGLNLVYGTMRLLNIAHGELVMFGGYVAYFGFTTLNVSPLLSMIIAAAIGAAFGVSIYILFFRRVLRSATLVARVEANSLLIFFGVSIILQNVAALAFSANLRGYVYLDQIMQIGSLRIVANRLILSVVATGLCLALVAFFQFNRVGASIRAVIQQREAAALVGIDVDRLNVRVFALGFGLAALAGSLVSMTQEISPFMGFPYTISAFVVITLGGLGNLLGTLLGAFVLAFVEVYGSAMFSSSYRSILVYGVFITILLISPKGLLGRTVAAR